MKHDFAFSSNPFSPPVLPSRMRLILLSALTISALINNAVYAEEPSATSKAANKPQHRTVGPATEKRFPPLIVPEGFQTTLFACDPLVEYPSVIAIGPTPGSLLVAHDYMTGLGTKIIRRDEIRILADTNGDGYADQSTLYAKGFNSIQGLAYDNGVVFVMHAPKLTRLGDTDGDGAADVRKELITGLGLPPEENSNRLHCANGVVAGYDGWLYLALGDRGCDVKRPEGNRLLFQQGGILRCRPDGRDLHVYAGGLRNIYDVALDADLNVFVRDNENDGGDYMIRVYHCFYGADHGYPYLYPERPDEALLPLADLGRGSSAGGAAYLETAFPPEFRESLFFCEWGRAVVRYPCHREGSSFVPMKEIEFAAGAPSDPYGFKPTDLIVDRDGSLLVSDWGDGQRPKRGRGRIYRIRYVGNNENGDVTADNRRSASATNSSIDNAGEKQTEPNLAELIKQLDSRSHDVRLTAQHAIEKRGRKVSKNIADAFANLGVRGRCHAVWMRAHVEGADAVDALFSVAGKDPDPRVRVQAVRALADLTDPVLVQHRLDAPPGDPQLAGRFAVLVSDKQDPRVVLECLIALARLRWSGAPNWLSENWQGDDTRLAHAAIQLLRRADNWSAVLKLLDKKPDTAKSPGLRTLALRAIADRENETIVDGLLQRLKRESNPPRRSEYLDALARVYKKRPPWEYWGFRPAPRPANTVAWERSEAIAEALDRALSDTSRDVRELALQRMLREKVPVRLASLARWLDDEQQPGRVAVLLAALEKQPAGEVRPLLDAVIRSKSHTVQNRSTALTMLIQHIEPAQQDDLLALANAIEDGPVLAALLRDFGGRPKLDAEALLLRKLDSKAPDVRAAAMTSLAQRGVERAAQRVVPLLGDQDAGVRRAAASAAGRLHVGDAVEPLRKLAASDDRALCRASLESLRVLGDKRAIKQAVSALDHAETQLAALGYLEDHADREQLEPVSKLAGTSRSSDVLAAVARVIASWRDQHLENKSHRLMLQRALAEVHGSSGLLLHWWVTDPLTADKAERLIQEIDSSEQPADHAAIFDGWHSQVAAGTEASVRLQPPVDTPKKTKANWLAVSGLLVKEPSDVEFLLGGSGALEVWLDGRSMFQRKEPAAFQPDSDRFDAKLTKGEHRLLVRVASTDANPRIQLRFRRKSSKAAHERLVQLALDRNGSTVRGREVFANVEKSQCAKCHRIGEQGPRIGPDLAGIGSRFSRIHLIESILEPSRTVAPSYATIVVALSDGRIFAGVKTAETETTISMGDNQGKVQTFAKSEIDELLHQPKSTMPDELEKRLTDQEFLDLLAYLLAQKKTATGK